jgi:hypothetical protein
LRAKPCWKSATNSNTHCNMSRQFGLRKASATRVDDGVLIESIQRVADALSQLCVNLEHARVVRRRGDRAAAASPEPAPMTVEDEQDINGLPEDSNSCDSDFYGDGAALLACGDAPDTRVSGGGRHGVIAHPVRAARRSLFVDVQPPARSPPMPIPGSLKGDSLYVPFAPKTMDDLLPSPFVCLVRKHATYQRGRIDTFVVTVHSCVDRLAMHGFGRGVPASRAEFDRMADLVTRVVGCQAVEQFTLARACHLMRRVCNHSPAEHDSKDDSVPRQSVYTGASVFFDQHLRGLGYTNVVCLSYLCQSNSGDAGAQSAAFQFRLFNVMKGHSKFDAGATFDDSEYEEAVLGGRADRFPTHSATWVVFIALKPSANLSDVLLSPIAAATASSPAGASSQRV